MDNAMSGREILENLLKRAQDAPDAASGAAVFPEADTASEGLESGFKKPRAGLFNTVHLKVRVELGRVDMPLGRVLDLAPGSVVDLEKLADDPVDIYVGDLLLARGEVIVLNDTLCVRVTEVLTQSDEGEHP